jgi:hypothetical protein
MDIIRRYRWREISKVRIMKKVKKLDDSFLENVRKGNNFLIIEPKRRDRAPRLYSSKPTLVLENNRTNLVLKLIVAEVEKDDDVYSLAEDKRGFDSCLNSKQVVSQIELLIIFTNNFQQMDLYRIGQELVVSALHWKCSQ